MNIHTHSYRSSPYRNSKGFTLVEALVGLVILALGLLSLARFHTSLIASSGLTKARTAAINYGQDKMEELRNMIGKGEFINTSTDPYTAGSLLFNNSDAATTAADNFTESFTRSWTVANTPADSTQDYQADIQVTVVWTGASGAQTIMLASKIAWLDPGSGTINTTSSSATPQTISFPGGNAVVGDGTTLDTNDPDLTISSPGSDNTRTATTGGGTVYLIDSANIILLTSTVPLTTISGIIGLDTGASPATPSSDIPLLDVVTTDAGYCSYPLKVSDGTPGIDPLFPNQAAYKCYVAGGWYGGIGFFGYADGIGGGATDDVCPAKTREYKGILFAADGTTIIGQFGVTTDQSGDDFIITKLTGSYTCDTVDTVTLPTDLTLADLTYADFADTSDPLNGLPGPLEPTPVIVSTTIGTVNLSGVITIDGAALSSYFSLSVVPAVTSGPATDGTCTSVVYSGGDPFATYSCEVQSGWSGTLTLNGIDAGDKTCVNGTVTATDDIDLSSITVSSNIPYNDFDIVDATAVTCP